MTSVDGLVLEWSLYKVKVVNGIKNSGLVSLDREEKVGFFFFYYEVYSFF